MNYYAQAIDLIFGQQIEARAILIEIAKQNPAAIVKGCKFLKKVPAWHEIALAYMQSGQKILAIKACREKTGMQLKEAKQAVEKLWKEGEEKWG